MKQYLSSIKENNTPICRVVGSGDFRAKDFVKNTGDFLIAADYGYNHLKKIGVVPEVIIGDFDSIEGEVPDCGIEILKFLPEKDDTDMFLAVKEGVLRGHGLFALYGGLGGGRISHTLSNIAVLDWLCGFGMQGFCLGENTEITVIKDGFIEYGAKESGNISVLAQGGNAAVNIMGLKYEAKNLSLSPSFALGVSNAFVGRAARVEVIKGRVIVVRD